MGVWRLIGWSGWGCEGVVWWRCRLVEVLGVGGGGG